MTLPDLTDVIREVAERQRHLGLYDVGEIRPMHTDLEVERLIEAAAPCVVPGEFLELMTTPLHPNFPIYPQVHEDWAFGEASRSDESEETLESYAGLEDQRPPIEPRWAPLVATAGWQKLNHTAFLPVEGLRAPIVFLYADTLSVCFPSLRTALLGALVSFDYTEEFEPVVENRRSSGLSGMWFEPGQRWPADKLDLRREYDQRVSDVCLEEDPHPLWPRNEPLPAHLELAGRSELRRRWAAWLAGYGTITPLPSDP